MNTFIKMLSSPNEISHIQHNAFYIFMFWTKAKAQESENIIEDNLRNYYSQILGYQVKEVFNTKVFDLIDTWLNTPYKYAGKNENGIDCSGFVNVIIKAVYGSSFGCSSVDMYNKLPHVSLKNLNPGDLVFFKNPWAKNFACWYVFRSG